LEKAIGTKLKFNNSYSINNIKLIDTMETKIERNHCIISNKAMVKLETRYRKNSSYKIKQTFTQLFKSHNFKSNRGFISKQHEQRIIIKK